MTSKRQSAGRSRGKSSTLYSALAGLLIGLIVAASLAFYITRAPLPFVDRASRQPDQGVLRSTVPVPDPNAALYGHDGRAGTPIPLSPPSFSTPAAPLSPDTPPKMDDLGALIATLPSTLSSSVSGLRTESAKPVPPSPISRSHFLQVGAYRLLSDAEALKARIILLGLPATVQSVEVNGKKINRVRVGPFARADEMDRARARLTKNKIESVVVHP